MIFDSFTTFMRSVVLPMQSAHPEWIRFDGASTGGNRDTVGSFVHGDDKWVVHADTHFEPLMLAWRAVGDGVEPFTRNTTDRGVRLDLIPTLQARKKDPDHRHMYIYLAG